MLKKCGLEWWSSLYGPKISVMIEDNCYKFITMDEEITHSTIELKGWCLQKEVQCERNY